MFCCDQKMRVERLEGFKQLVYCQVCGRYHIEDTRSHEKC